MFERLQSFDPFANPADAKIAVIAVVFLSLFALERWMSAAASPLSRRDGFRRIGRNAGLYGLNSLMWPLVTGPVTLCAVANGLWDREALLRGWMGPDAPESLAPWLLLLDLICLDLFIYGWHRANHEAPFLWRFHRVHHRDRFLDTTSAVRFHFGEVLMSALIRGVAIAALSIPFSHVLVFETVVLLCALFHHSNIRLPQAVDRMLAWVIVTPGWHWMHHHAVRQDTDSNYGNLLTIWDRLFRSRSQGARSLTMPIGTEGLSQDVSLGRLLLWPFRRSRTGSS